MKELSSPPSHPITWLCQWSGRYPNGAGLATLTEYVAARTWYEARAKAMVAAGVGPEGWAIHPCWKDE